MLYGVSPFMDPAEHIMSNNIIEKAPEFPKDLKYSEAAIDLIKKLLEKNPSSRIGHDDEQDIFLHPWFNDIEFTTLLSRKVSPCQAASCVGHPSYRRRRKCGELLRSTHQGTAHTVMGKEENGDQESTDRRARFLLRRTGVRGNRSL